MPELIPLLWLRVVLPALACAAVLFGPILLDSRAAAAAAR
jgi:hypothetical protein